MAWQLVYTSAPRLLEAGRSGFGTVARSKDLRPLLLGPVERCSGFERSAQLDKNRIVFSFRHVNVSGSRYFVVSRIRDAGADYSGRTNHIAHHLIFDQREVRQLANSQISPAGVALKFNWLDRWEGPPEYLNGTDQSNFRPEQPIIRDAWLSITGDSRYASLLISDPNRSKFLVGPFEPTVDHEQKLALCLFDESMRLRSDRAWDLTFTSSYQPIDEQSALIWKAVDPVLLSVIRIDGARNSLIDLRYPENLPAPIEFSIVVKSSAPTGHHAVVEFQKPQTSALPGPDLPPVPENLPHGIPSRFGRSRTKVAINVLAAALLGAFAAVVLLVGVAMTLEWWRTYTPNRNGTAAKPPATPEPLKGNADAGPTIVADLTPSSTPQVTSSPVIKESSPKADTNLKPSREGSEEVDRGPSVPVCYLLQQSLAATQLPGVPENMNSSFVLHRTKDNTTKDFHWIAGFDDFRADARQEKTFDYENRHIIARSSADSCDPPYNLILSEKSPTGVFDRVLVHVLSDQFLASQHAFEAPSEDSLLARSKETCARGTLLWRNARLTVASPDLRQVQLLKGPKMVLFVPSAFRAFSNQSSLRHFDDRSYDISDDTKRIKEAIKTLEEKQKKPPPPPSMIAKSEEQQLIDQLIYQTELDIKPDGNAIDSRMVLARVLQASGAKAVNPNIQSLANALQQLPPSTRYVDTKNVTQQLQAEINRLEQRPAAGETDSAAKLRRASRDMLKQLLTNILNYRATFTLATPPPPPLSANETTWLDSLRKNPLANGSPPIGTYVIAIDLGLTSDARFVPLVEATLER